MIEDPPEVPQTLVGSLLCALEDSLSTNVERYWIDEFPTELRRGPEICLVVAPERLLRRPLDRMVLSRYVVEREARRNRLLIEWIGLW